MEFSFDVNYVLPYEVTIFNGEYRILNQGHVTRIYAADKLTTIIDTIGEASFKAQGLSGAVTTARKFRISNHRLYIIKRANDNNNHGSVVGILKVGPKHLYIYDENGRVHEQTPLCVLDFYVHESKQRLGYGKRLFDTMLEFEKCAPHELAIDRPSNKCLAFLNKHYHLSSPIHQVNNFVVYSAFFNQPPNDMKTVTKQREELSTWLMPSERESSRRPFLEQNDVANYYRSRTMPDENELFSYRQPTISYYTTTYGQHYNKSAVTHSGSPLSRAHSQVFGEDTLQRNNTNSQSLLTPMSSYRRTVETVNSIAQPKPMTSVYTFPSWLNPVNNWYQQQQQTVDSSSSGWRIFGTHRLLN